LELTILGVYAGNDLNELRTFESWLGRDVDAVHATVGGANWWDFTESASFLANKLWNQADEPILWSVPLLVPNGSPTLAQAATGQFNTQYADVAHSLLESRADDNGPIYIRAGWEFNLQAFPWQVNGNEGDFVGAYRQFVDSFRDVSDRFKFEWNLNVSWGPADPAKAYPGDNYVDVVGMDFYWSPYYQGSDPNKAWDLLVNAPYGMQWLENFASAHGKPTAYSEWGIQSDNAAPFIEKAHDWFASHNVVYQSYWNSSADGVGKLSDNHLPHAAEAYKAEFGGESAAAAPAVIPAASPVTAPAALVGAATSWFVASGQWQTSTGTQGNDHFVSVGSDTMQGGDGQDTYEVSALNDRVVEAANGGTDTVVTWVNGYVLPDNVEKLVLTGTGWTNGTGNNLDNTITGNDAPNVLDGKGGNDILAGQGGSDLFVITKGLGTDTVTDFHPHAWGAAGADTLLLKGFGEGAQMWNSGDHFSIKASDGSVTDVALSGIHSLNAQDYVFG
jgi:hypothetical protein